MARDVLAATAVAIMLAFPSGCSLLPASAHDRPLPWEGAIPSEIRRGYVEPDTNLNERRDDWRAGFRRKFRPLVEDCATPGEAAVVLNTRMWDMIGVQYHPTRRPKPCQSPFESIEAGYASCTGLSILLVDACRSVGVPARVVGTPSWVVPQGDASGNHGGNHTWVEVWDDGWHFLGAIEPGPLDRTWFVENARRADPAVPEHRIYAVSPVATGIHFPMVWDPENHDTPAEDVTGFYRDLPAPAP